MFIYSILCIYLTSPTFCIFWLPNMLWYLVKSKIYPLSLQIFIAGFGSSLAAFEDMFKVALYKDVENLELKTHNFVITQDTTKNEVPDEGRSNQL